MNKHLHRIVFNAARGLRMVVQETAKSTGRGARKATSGGAGAGSAAVSVAAIAAALMSAPLHAQIVADPNAPGGQRPTVLGAPNSVPVVNIQTPSAAGVSRNTYSQFDVQRNGVILNNSRGNAQTQLGGWVQGNPWLATGSARVILNEVNSVNPSQLRGYVEVAGPRTEVIIANPAGIQVDGGGFINVNRATLTTGTPQYGASGSLDGYVVRSGTVGISGSGLDASSTDSLSILSRAFELSGALHATDLTVVAGAVQVAADLTGITPIAGTGSSPSYAIDVAQLGGMYANHIALVVNEQGVGARNAGTIQTSAGSYTLAGAGKLTLSADGMLENSGFIQTSSDATIRAAGLANSGTVHSAASLEVSTQSDLANHIGSTGGTLEGQRVELSSAAGNIDNRAGTIRQTSAAAFTVTAPNLSNTNAGFIGAEPVTSSAGSSSGNTGASSGGGTSSGGTSTGGSTSGTTTEGSTSTNGSTSTATPPAVVSPGSLTAAGSILNDGGKVYAGGDIALQTPNVNNDGGTLNVASMALSGPSFSNAGGKLNVSNTFIANVGTLNNAGGSLHAGTIGITTTGGLNNQGGTLAGDGAVDLSVGGAADNSNGTITAVGSVNATVAGSLDNTSGNLLGNAAVTVAAGSLNNTLGSVQSASGAMQLAVAHQLLNDKGSIGAATDLSVQAGSLANTGTLRAERDSTVTVTNAFSNDGGITSGRNTKVVAGSLDGSASGVLGAGVQADGTLGTAGDLSTTTTGSLKAAGTVLAAGGIALQGTSTDLSGSKTSGANIALTATTGDVTTSHATVTTPGALRVTANSSAGQSLSNDAGELSAGQLDLHASNIQNTTAGHIVQTGTGATTIAVTGTLDNTGGTIGSNSQDLTLAASTVRNTGGAIEHAGNGTLAIAATTFSGANGTIVGNGDLVIRADTFNQDGGSTSAKLVKIDTADLSNRAGSIIQTGAGTTHITSTASLVNDGGTIASNGTELNLSAGALSNANGHLQHAGTGALNLAANSYDAAGGEIITNGDLAASITGAFNQDTGTITAQKIALSAGSLSNRGGKIVQTGSSASRLDVTGALDNATGAIASNGDLSVAAGSLGNQGGSVRAAGTASLGITTADLLDNSHSGVIGAGGDLALHAGRLSNDAGSVTAVGNLEATVSGAASNVAGTLAANGNTTIAAANLDNTQGTMAAVTGDLSVTTSGTTTNTQGTLQAAGRTSLSNTGLVNIQGKVTGNALAVNTSGGALDNTLGTLAATTTIDLQSGALTNDKGLAQSGGAMTVNTHGQALVNTNAAGHSSGQGGIVSGGSLALNAGATDNTAGFIGAKDALTAATGGFTNAAGGMVLGQANVAIATNGATYDNRGGQTLAFGNLGIDAGGGTVQNSGGLLRSGGTTTVSAGAVDNSATLGTDQGIEGQNVAVTAANLNNDGGAIRADTNATITSAGSVSNVNGLMSAGDTLAILDPAPANPGAKALFVGNTGGTLTAGKSLQLDAATFSAAGTLSSGQDLSIALTQNLVNNATVSANRNLTYATTGTLTNNGKLLAGNVLTVSGSDVENTASGEMRGDTTIVNASGTLTNRGLIDGHDTRINAGALVNASTGRIYGDHLSIAAGSVLNDADGSSAGTIAARDRLDIGAGSITNRDGALIFSGGDMHIGGALDANRQATGAASLLENKAATIEALGNVDIKAGTLNNLNGGVTYTTVAGPSEHIVEYAMPGSGQRVSASDVVFTFGWRYTTQWDAQGGVRANDPTVETRSAYKIFFPPAEYPLAKYAAYYASTPSNSVDYGYESCSGTGDSVSCGPAVKPGAWYAATDPIWADFGVTPPPVLSATNPGRSFGAITVGLDGYDVPVGDGTTMRVLFDHPVTQAEFNEWAAYVQAHTALDAATLKFIEAFLGVYNPMPGMTGPGLSSTWDYWDYTRTSSTPVLQSSAPGRILSGGAMTLSVGSGTNDMSQILAGGALAVQGGTITNHNDVVNADVTESGTSVHSYVKSGGAFGSSSRAHETTPYNLTVSTTVELAAARQEGNQNATSAKGLANAQAISVNAGTTSAGAVSVGHRVNPVIEVASAVGGAPGVTGSASNANGSSAAASTGTAGTTKTSSSAGQSLVVRTTAPDSTVPKASLFKTVPGATSHYLVETDPAFTDNRRWLSSDYLLNNLGLDPDTTLKRLGDGFYEQRLVREQVAQLTGYRYIEGFNSDEAQYNALMNAGVTFAEQYHLTPGIALSAEQMAQLTSDIVWLVEQTVTLADGSTQRVLVPQVYVRVKPGDIDGSGALLSGSSVNLNLSGDLNNQGGTIAGRTTVALTADNINNLAGRITGKDVVLVAGTDLNNIGGMIDAQNSLGVIAGRNVNVITTTSDASSSATTARGSIEQERTVIDRVAGLYVSDPGGTLAVYAGGNINTAGAQIVSDGSVELNARGDVQLDSVTTGQSETIRWSSRNSRIDGSSSETGTTVSGGTNVTINAGGDITAQAAALSAGKDLSLEAGGQIVLYAGQDQTYAQTEYSQRSGMSYSSLEASSSDTALARTTLDAENVKLRSGGDTTLGAIKVDANTLDIQAGGQLNLLTQTTSSSRSRNESDGDAMFVNAGTKGNIDETTNYNEFNVASVHLQANGGINANVAKGADLTTLAQQPGMAWVNQLISDPALVNSTQWKTVEEAHKKWQTDQSSLGPVSSAIVMLVVAVATVGAGTAAAGTAGAGTTAGTGMAGAMGLTAAQTTILAGALQAGITTLVGQATISMVNNGGNLAKVFDELGSSQSVKNLLTAMVTGGALAGLNLNPVTGQATAEGGKQLFIDQLAQNVKGGVATALIRTAINGGSLEDALKDSLKSAFLSTIAAQTANEIGNLDGFMNKLAHAIAGCAVGAASAGNGGGCASGAIGAVIGELTAEAMGRRDDTVAVAALMAGLAAAVAGGDATQVNLAAGAGGNAAANNYLNHDEAALRERLKDKQRQGQSLTATEQQTLDNLEVLDIARDLALRDACSTPGDACNAARRTLNAALSSYTSAAGMTNANLSTAGNAAVAGERDQSIALGNDPSLAAQGFLDGFLEFAVPQLAGYAIGGALGAYVNEARALYAAIKSETGGAAAAALTIGSSGGGGVVPGKLIGTVEGLTAAEQSFIGEMVAGGKTVQVIPSTNAGRSADFFIDGVKYELKTMSNVANQTSDGLSKSLSSTIMDARGQSGNIIIDARGQAGMTPEIAERGIIRGLNADKESKVKGVTVITSQGTVYIPRKSS